MFMFPTIKLNIERWKYNPTFELYVSNMGHIRNKSKADIAPKIMENGYVVVYVNGSINGYMLLHRVVMLTWKPTPEAEKLTVDHLDHNKRNNALSNLEWVTKTENLRRANEDYVGCICPIGCEFIKNVVTKSGKPSTKANKKATIDSYMLKIEKVKYFLVEPDRRNGANSNRPTCRFEVSEKGYAELAEACKGLSQFKIAEAKRKVEAMKNGQNRTGHSFYCGMCIRPIFDEPAAE